MTSQKVGYIYRPSGKLTAENAPRYGKLPIYYLYVQVVPSQNGKQPPFNLSNYERVGTEMWWRPSDNKVSLWGKDTQKVLLKVSAQQTAAALLAGTNAACSGYIQYNQGDEFTYNPKTSNCISLNSSSSLASTKIRNATKGTVVSINSVAFMATGQTFSWSLYTTKVDTQQKKPAPFGNETVMIWVRLDNKYPNAKSYEPNVLAIDGVTPLYYDEQLKNFGPINNWKKLNTAMAGSPDPDTASSNPAGVSTGKGGSRSSGKSKFNTFNGDNDGLDLASLVDAQLAELLSRGSTPESALATVIDVNERAIYNMNYNPLDVEFDSSEFMQKPFREEGEPPLSGNALPVLRPGEFTPSEMSISVRFSNSGTGYSGAQSTPDVPVMIQTYPYYDANTDSMAFVADKFFFHYKPNNITYNNIGAEWQDIPRVNNTPLVDFKNFKLMKITFEFIVAEKLDDVSSLYASCEAQLKMLRQMATRPEFVQFTNMDTLFSEQLIYPDFFSSGVATYFSIVDMSITSVQRSRQGVDTVFGSTPGSINRATVNMTVQEVNSSGPPPIFLPRITQPPKTPPPPDIPGKDQLCKSRFTWISPARWQQKPQPQSCD